MSAARSGQLSMIDTLLHFCDEDFTTALSNAARVAARGGHNAVVLRLLEDSRTCCLSGTGMEDGMTENDDRADFLGGPITAAAHEGHAALVRTLLAHPSDFR